MLAYVLQGETFLPFRLIQSLSAFLFFFAGDVCKKLCDSVSRWLDQRKLQNLVGYVAATVVLLGITWWMARLSDKDLILAGNCLPDNWLVTVVGGMSGCLALMLLSMMTASVPGLSKFLAFFGCNSMVVMGLHSEIRVGSYFVLEVIMKLSGWMVELTVFVLTIVVCVPVVCFINRYLPVLSGRKVNKTDKKTPLQCSPRHK